MVKIQQLICSNPRPIRPFFVLCLLTLFILPATAATLQFSPVLTYSTGETVPGGIATADFNGDGKLDFAATYTGENVVRVYLNTGAATFAAPITTTFANVDAVSVFRAGNFNEDGKQDLIAGLASTAGSVVAFLSGNGDGTFTQQATVPTLKSGLSISTRVADVNHDSHLDLILGYFGVSDLIDVFLGDGHGNFSNTSQGHSYLPIPANQGNVFNQGMSIVTADFKNNNKPDILVPVFARTFQGQTTSGIFDLSGIGDGTFSPPIFWNTDPGLLDPLSISTADFNGDGNLDLLIGSISPRKATISFGNGDGTFQLDTPQILFPFVSDSEPNPDNGISPTVFAADMDGDGKPDVFAIDPFSTTLNVFLNDGAGHFGLADFTMRWPAGLGVLIGDFNGDGLPDIFSLNAQLHTISIYPSIRPKVTPTLTLSGSANQQLAGSPFTVTAAVSGIANIAATGTATLFEGTTSLAQQTLNSNGQASFTVSSLPAGQHTLYVSYSGDQNYTSATGTSTFTASITDFQVPTTITAASVNRGASASYTINLTPAGFTGTVSFTCSGLPATSTCVAPTVTLNGQPIAATLQVTTSPAVTQSRSAIIPVTRSVAFASLLMVLLLPLRRRALPGLLALVLASAGTFLISGCSGSNSSSSGGSQTTGSTSPGNPSGTIPFTIVASATQGGVTVSHSIAATLTVN